MRAALKHPAGAHNCGLASCLGEKAYKLGRLCDRLATVYDQWGWDEIGDDDLIVEVREFVEQIRPLLAGLGR